MGKPATVAKRSKCKCLNTMENVIGINFEVDTKFDVKRVTIQEVDLLSDTTFSNVEIRYMDKEKEKKKKVLLAHSYCPFCGKAYPR